MFNHTPMVRRYRDPATGRLIYVFADSLSGLWLVNTDGSGLRLLTRGYLSEPDWDSPGTKLAFVQGGGYIWTMAGTDTGLAVGSASVLTPISGALSPSWRPDGAAVAFSANGGASARIYIVDSSGPAREIGAPGWAFPDWSPGGDSLVFLGNEGSRWGVCVTDTSGQGFRMLWGSSEANLGPPRWAPVGGKIAVAGRVRNRDPYQLWVMASDGSNPRPLTQERVQSFIAWSPDGKEIAYVRSQLADTSLTNGTIWIIDVGTGTKRQLTFNSPSE